jgi:septal ring-binding cell division protein DamX
MCGRARASLSVAAVSRAAGVPAERWVDEAAYQPRYNAAPGCVLPVLRLAAPAGGAADATDAQGPDDAPDAPRERQLQARRAASTAALIHALPARVPAR